MNKTITSEQLLKTLEIPDFRHVTKDKLISFASMIEEMDPETARLAIEQFPNFSKMALEIMKDYRESMISLIGNNRAISEKSIEALNGIIDMLNNNCSKDDISFEEKRYYIEQIMEVGSMISAIDRENREFNRQGMILGFIAAVVIPAIASAILGVRIRSVA